MNKSVAVLRTSSTIDHINTENTMNTATIAVLDLLAVWAIATDQHGGIPALIIMIVVSVVFAFSSLVEEFATEDKSVDVL